MTVGLIRSEAADETRVLTATGATSTIRRTITAATTAALALLGVALGGFGAYVGVAAGYVADIGALSSVPILQLLMIAAGVPALAACGGWLLAGREPTAIARHPIE
jgi:putative ABC transport system permease protein